MDIPALSMAMSQGRLMDSVGTAVLSKALDMAEVTGEGIADMLDASVMERSVAPYLGGNIDISL